MLKSQEIHQKETELANLEKRFTELQIPISEPQLDGFDDVETILQARRQWQQSERDRVDELAAIEVILPKQRSQLAIKKQQYSDLETKVETGFKQLSDAAIEANKILNDAREAIAKFEKMAVEQRKAGHEIVFNSDPYYSHYNSDLPIFAIGSTRITKWERGEFDRYQRSGQIREVRT
jgi:hypothetical protein